jgi:SNF2 family DNA or RNA helicase
VPPFLRKNEEANSLELDLSGARGPEFHDALAKIREIPGRRFDFETKIWSVELKPDVADRILRTIRPGCDDELRTWVRDSKLKQIEDLTTPLPPDAKLLLPWSNKRMPWQPEVVNDEPFNGLLDYQRAAVDKMVRLKRVILADDMGLGKTIQAIAAIEESKLRAPDGVGYDGPKLIVCPKSVIGSWQRELHRWLGPDVKVQAITGTTAKAKRNQLLKGIEDNAWIITNWEQIQIEKIRKPTNNGGVRTIRQIKEQLYETTPWSAVVADEVHRAKNPKAKRTEGLWRIQAPVMYGLTGTPVQNAPDELWSLLRWLWPHQYNQHQTAQNKNPTAYGTFYNTYVEAWEDDWGRQMVIGVKNPDQLRFELRERLIRRTIGQVRSVPGRRRIPIPLEMGKRQRDIYIDAETQMWLTIAADAEEGDTEAQRMLKDTTYLIKNGASRVVRLRQILESPAVLGGPDESVILDDLVERFLDSRPAPWLVFSAFKPTTDIIQDRLGKFNVETYTGDTPGEERTELEDRFQAGDIDLLVGTIDAMREGITLTYGHLQYWCSRAWVPGWNEQGEMRQADRLGQQNKTMIYIPQVKDSVAVSHVKPANELKENIVRTVIRKDAIEEAAA